MSALLGHAMTRVWALLVGATLALFMLAEGAANAHVATIAVILIAAFKVRLVFLHFMELGSGAMPWRAIAEAWVLIVTALLLGTYLATHA